MARFTGIPNILGSGADPWQIRILSAIKQNVELMAGLRSEGDSASRAVLRGDISVARLPAQSLGQVTAKGVSVTVTTGVYAAEAADYYKLINDVQTMANDMYTTRQALNALLKEMGR